jgi:hypothetical protein
MKKILKIFLFTLFCFLTTSGWAANISGCSLSFAVQDNSGKEIVSFSCSYALVIGVSNYSNGWPALPSVKNDIKAVVKILERNNFQVTKVLDPNSSELEAAFENFIRDYGFDEKHRLLFYFAGHGYPIKPDPTGLGDGYLVPADAPNPNNDLSKFKQLALNMKRIEEFSLSLESRHAIFIFDAAFLGTPFSMTNARAKHVNYETSQPVRQYIIAGSSNDTFTDKSFFSQQFIAGLNGAADFYKDGYITGTELAEFLQKSVNNYSNGSLNMQYGKIKNSELSKGDFVFIDNSKSATGSMQVMSEPSHVSIYLNGKPEGVTPVILENLSSGSYQVEGRKNGYRYDLESVKVSNNKRSQVILILNKEKNTGSLSITSKPDKARWFLNGDYKGITSDKIFILETGVHKIKVRKKGYKNWWKKVQVQKGKEVKIKAILKKKSKSKKVEQIHEYIDELSGMTFVWVKGGCFFMGSPEREDGH